MFLTITSIVVAALFGFALSVAIRMSNINGKLRHKIKDIKSKNQELFDDKESWKSSLDKLCSAMTHEDVSLRSFSMHKRLPLGRASPLLYQRIGIPHIHQKLQR